MITEAELEILVNLPPSVVRRLSPSMQAAVLKYLRQKMYSLGYSSPNYPMPAVVSHLNFIAAELQVGWEDFRAIGWHGRVRCRDSH